MTRFLVILKGGVHHTIEADSMQPWGAEGICFMAGKKIIAFFPGNVLLSARQVSP